MSQPMHPTSGRPAADAPWAVLIPADTPTVTVPRAPLSRRTIARQLHSLPVPSPVALVGSGPVNRSRLRRTAASAGIVIEHEYVVLPTISSGRYVVEDDPDAMAVLWQNLVTPPPGVTRATALVTVLAALGRSRLPWWLLGRLGPRLALGYRGEGR